MSATAAYFGGLSISSLASDDRSDLFSEGEATQSQLELYQRLQDLEEITANYLMDRPIELKSDHDTFAEIERNHFQDFELRIKSFSANDVLTLSISCLPDCMNEAFEAMHLDEHMQPPLEHHPLKISMVQSFDQTLSTSERENSTIFLPKLYNGDYSFVLTTAHGMKSGLYVLTVANEENAIDESRKIYQSIRVSYRIHSSVRAITIENSRSILGRVGSNDFIYYRYVLKDPSQLLSIKVLSLPDENGVVGDADVYVSNKYDGLIGVTKQNYIWRSATVGNCRVDIHPNDQNHSRGNFFVIGVLGYRDRNDFSLQVTVCRPPPILEISYSSSGVNNEISVMKDQYLYFSMKIDTQTRERINISIGHSSSLSETLNRGVQTLNDVNQSYGRGVYTKDTLTTSGLLIDIRPDNLNPIEKSQPDFSSLQRGSHLLSSFDSSLGSSINHEDSILPQEQHMNVLSLKPSVSREIGIFPMVFISDSVMYPDSTYYTWKASGDDGVAAITIESDELRFSSSVLYIAVYGLHIDCSGCDEVSVTGSEKDEYDPRSVTYQKKLFQDDSNLKSHQSKNYLFNEERKYDGVDMTTKFASRFSSDTRVKQEDKMASASEFKLLKCTIRAQSFNPLSSMSHLATTRLNIFNRIFRDLDGFAASHKDRARLGVEDASFTYAEVDYVAFQQLLRDAGAKDGHIFYDLGCGVGKALVAAMFSEIRFLQCVGMELMPSVCELARKASSRARNAVLKSSGNDYQIPKTISHSPDSRGFGSSGNLVSLTTVEANALRPLEAGMSLIEIRECNFIDADYSDADIIFLSSLCYSDALLVQFMKKASSSVKSGAIIMTLKLIDGFDDDFILTGTVWSHQSWGRCKVYFLKKKNN